MIFSFYGKEFKLATIRKIFINCGCKGGQAFLNLQEPTETKFMKFIEYYPRPRNMDQKVLKLSPNIALKEDEKHWISDFQAFNENTPKHVRDLIINAFPKQKKR